MKVKWEEPVEFSRAFARSSGSVPTRRAQVLAGVIAAAVVGVIIPAFQGFFYLLHQKDLGVPVYVYFVAPVLAGVFVGFLPAMISVIPAKVILDEKGIHRNKPIGTAIAMEFWLWEAVSALAIKDVEYNHGAFRVLVVRRQEQDGEILIGLGTAPVERIGELARHMGKALDVRV